MVEANHSRTFGVEMSHRSESIVEIISNIENSLDRLLGQSRWHSMIVCDDLAWRYGGHPEVRKAYGNHPKLGPALAARAQGLRLDAVAECYPRPDHPADGRYRIKEMRIGSYDNDLELAAKNARELWQWDSHGNRHRGRPKALGLVDFADKRPAKSRLISAKPLGKTLTTALTALTENQRIVYQGRVLDEPPRTLGDLAKELGVSRKRIVVLERRACERMEQFLLEPR
jgi:hypothetical protein